MIKISAVIITFNEERNIVRCIQSLKDVADEIIVVDSFSTDTTEELCKAFGVRFIKHAFEGYKQQKAWASDKASYDYILSLDADEELTPELKHSISEVKSDWKSDGYKFNRLNNYLGKWIKHCGWYPDAKIRLWDRRKGSWGGINPHDIVMMQNGAIVHHLKGDLLHYSYHSINQHLRQINSFTDISSMEAYKAGKSASAFKIVYKSIWKFNRDYIFKLGFLDGYYGLLLCLLSAFAVFMKYVKLKELIKAGK